MSVTKAITREARASGRVLLHVDEQLTVSLARLYGRAPLTHETITTYSDLLSGIETPSATAQGYALDQHVDRGDQAQGDQTDTLLTQPPPPHAWDGEEGFEELQPLGEGGMGVVYQAEQRSLLREVAIKQLKHLNPELEEHLVREARLMGRLSHPNIPPVYTLHRGESGYAEVVMKKIEGETLLDWCGDEPLQGLKLQEGLKHIIQVCYALEFAHNQGIVHRDIKAENIMLGRFHEVYLMDWGVALDLNQLSEAPHGVVGTPRHLAPEMLSGDPAHISPLTDVYLLGTLLHQLLTGQPRHNASTLVECFRLSQKSKHHVYPNTVPRELSALCNQACERDPSARMSSMQSFREGLEEYLDLWEVRELVALAKDLSQAYERLLFTQDPHESALWETAHQAKSAFDQALYLRPHLTEVTRARDHLIMLMLRRALSRKELIVARSLVRELSDTADKMAFDRDIASLIRQEREPQSSLSSLAYGLESQLPFKPQRPLIKLLLASLMCVILGGGIWFALTQEYLSLNNLRGVWTGGIFGSISTLCFMFFLRGQHPRTTSNQRPSSRCAHQGALN